MIEIIKKNIVLPMIVVMALSINVFAETTSVGTTLHKKESVELTDVPAGVISVKKEANPDFEMLEAQKELKHGNTYYDIEGLTASGNEIEFDMLFNADGTWSIAEIQRDLTLEQTPQPVTELYEKNVVGVVPVRIIESDQGGGVIVYEFFTNEQGQEKKYEIKLEVELLEKEWTH